jgi:hypothetical protein
MRKEAEPGDTNVWGGGARPLDQWALVRNWDAEESWRIFNGMFQFLLKKLPVQKR